jgi:hypothetical protein
MALRIPSRSGLAHLRGHKKHLTVDQFLDSAPGVFLVGSGVSGFKAPVFFLGSGAYSDNHPASAMFQKRKPGDETGLLKDDPLYCGAARAPILPWHCVARGSVLVGSAFALRAAFDACTALVLRIWAGELNAASA